MTDCWPGHGSGLIKWKQRQDMMTGSKQIKGRRKMKSQEKKLQKLINHNGRSRVDVDHLSRCNKLGIEIHSMKKVGPMHILFNSLNNVFCSDENEAKWFCQLPTISAGKKYIRVINSDMSSHSTNSLSPRPVTKENCI